MWEDIAQAVIDEYKNRWLLNLVSRQVVESASVVAQETVYFHDNIGTKGSKDIDYRGLVTYERTKKYPNGSWDDNDYEIWYDYSNEGHLTRKVWDGGDTNLFDGTHNKYIEHYYWIYGVMNKSEWRTINDEHFLDNFERGIDKTGLISWEKDSAGLMTSYDYDAMFRKIKVMPPGDDLTTTYISYSDTMRPLQVQVDRVCEGPDVFSTYWYDQMGRLQIERHKGAVHDGAPGGAVCKAYDYDHRGNLLHETEWIVGDIGVLDENTPRRNYSYLYDDLKWDPFGRVKEVSFYDENTDEVLRRNSYEGTTTWITTNVDEDRELVTQYVQDALGRLIRVIQHDVDESGSSKDYITGYQYNALGQITKVGGPGFIRSTFTYDGMGNLVTADEWENGTRQYYYDAMSIQIGTVNNDGQQHYWKYDPAGRKIESQWRQGEGSPWYPKGEWVYDKVGAPPDNHGLYANGKVCEITSYKLEASLPIHKVSTQKYYYTSEDNGGRVSYEKIWYNGWQDEEDPPLMVSYLYNGLGQVAEIGYPRIEGETSAYPRIRNQYACGFLHKVNYFNGTGMQEYPLTAQNGMTYNPAGGLHIIPADNGVTTTIDYDTRNRPERVKIEGSSTLYNSDLYAYDRGGALTQMGSDSFEYDELGRITGATISGQQITYTYDRHGNMLSRTGLPGTFNRSYLHNKIFGIGAGYDGRGNLTHIGMVHNMTYNADSRQVEYENTGTDTQATYAYNTDGERVLKIVQEPSGSYREEAEQTLSDDGEGQLSKEETKGTTITKTYYVRDLTGKVLTEFFSVGSGGGGFTMIKRARDYVYVNGENFAMLKPKAGGGFDEYYYHNDHLGSPPELTSEAGNEAEKYRYFPFGGLDSSRSIQALNTHKFSGKERDSESELDYFEARYYSNTLARFINCDLVRGLADNPQTWNKYTYCLNNPLVFIDPSGLEVVLFGPHQDLLLEIIEIIRAVSPTFDATYGLYDEKHEPTLNVGFGSLDPDENGQIREGLTEASFFRDLGIAPDGKSNTDTVTFAKLKSSTITISSDFTNKKGIKRGKRNKVAGELIHEFGHADNNARDPLTNAQRQHNYDKGILEQKDHSKRPEETSNIPYINKVYSEIKASDRGKRKGLRPTKEMP